MVGKWREEEVARREISSSSRLCSHVRACMGVMEKGSEGGGWKRSK